MASQLRTLTAGIYHDVWDGTGIFANLNLRFVYTGLPRQCCLNTTATTTTTVRHLLSVPHGPRAFSATNCTQYVTHHREKAAATYNCRLSSYRTWPRFWKMIKCKKCVSSSLWNSLVSSACCWGSEQCLVCGERCWVLGRVTFSIPSFTWFSKSSAPEPTPCMQAALRTLIPSF